MLCMEFILPARTQVAQTLQRIVPGSVSKPLMSSSTQELLNFLIYLRYLCGILKGTFEIP